MSNEANRVKLLGITDPFRGKEFYITAEQFTVGRSNESDLLLAENTISANHAKLVKNGNKFELYDLNSTNGTYVNNERISRKELRSDDVLKFDVYEFRFINVGDVARTVLADSPNFERVSDTEESPIVQAPKVKQNKPPKKAKAKFEKTGNLPMGLVVGVLMALVIYIGSAIGSQIIDSGMPYDFTPVIETSFISMPLAHTHFFWLSPSMSWTIGFIVFIAGLALAAILGGWLTRAISKKNIFASSFYFALSYAVISFIGQLVVTRLVFSKLTYLYSAVAPFGFFDALIAMPIIFAYFICVAFVLAFFGAILKGK